MTTFGHLWMLSEKHHKASKKIENAIAHNESEQKIKQLKKQKLAIKDKLNELKVRLYH